MQASENDTDFAIEGEGFFSVRGDDGNVYYTRNGSFFWAIGPTGTTLCNTDGYPVLDSNGNPIVVPDGVMSSNMRITSDGVVGYVTAEGTYTAMNQTVGLYQFTNPAGLQKLSRSLLSETAASGAAMNELTTNGLKIKFQGNPGFRRYASAGKQSETLVFQQIGGYADEYGNRRNFSND